MPLIKSFRELKTYQRARSEARIIFDVSKTFPREEKYSLTDQVRRSSRAVCAMLGEAWARRRYEAVFVNKVSEALGEAAETQTWIDHAFDCGYITRAEHAQFDRNWAEISAMLQGMIDKAGTFCGARSDK